MPNNLMDAKQTVLTLSEASMTHVKQYCLLHLVTQRNFDGTLGIASIAKNTPPPFEAGICGGKVQNSGNIGLSTTIDANGHVLPMSVYVLVVTHELGHNFGSKHDPEHPDKKSKKCTPTTAEGGRYIMWPAAGVPHDRNSWFFSKCSREVIESVLRRRAHRCFIPTTTNRCGNGVRDPTEQCDVGFENQSGDKCCTDKCKLRPNATCSQFNDPCCTPDCQVAPATQHCSPDNNTYDGCYEKGSCTGKDSITCVRGNQKADNSDCGDKGKCMNGVCLSFCQVLGFQASPKHHLETCTCDQNSTTMCLHCCRAPGEGSKCQIRGGTRQLGSVCLYGFCAQEGCVEEESDELELGEMDLEEGTDDSLVTALMVGGSVLVGVLVAVGSIVVYQKSKDRMEMPSPLRKLVGSHAQIVKNTARNRVGNKVVQGAGRKDSVNRSQQRRSVGVRKVESDNNIAFQTKRAGGRNVSSDNKALQSRRVGDRKVESDNRTLQSRRADDQKGKSKQGHDPKPKKVTKRARSYSV